MHFSTKLLWGALIALCVGGCSAPGKNEAASVKVVLDNPTNENISLQLDGQSYVLSPTQRSVALNLAAGMHELVLPSGERLEWALVDSRPLLLNPTLTDYVIENVTFGRGSSPDRQIEIDGVIFEGPFKLMEGFFINHDQSYGLDEAVPNQIEVSQETAGSVRTKLYRKPDFIAEIEQRANQHGLYEANRTSVPDAPTLSLPAPPELEDAELQQAMAEYNALFRTYLEGKPWKQDMMKRLESKRALREATSAKGRALTAQAEKAGSQRQALLDFVAWRQDLIDEGVYVLY